MEGRGAGNCELMKLLYLRRPRINVVQIERLYGIVVHRRPNCCSASRHLAAAIFDPANCEGWRVSIAGGRLEPIWPHQLEPMCFLTQQRQRRPSKRQWHLFARRLPIQPRGTAARTCQARRLRNDGKMGVPAKGTGGTWPRIQGCQGGAATLGTLSILTRS
jgi:hypothetical protein